MCKLENVFRFVWERVKCGVHFIVFFCLVRSGFCRAVPSCLIVFIICPRVCVTQFWSWCGGVEEQVCGGVGAGGGGKFTCIYFVIFYIPHNGKRHIMVGNISNCCSGGR